MKRNNIHPANKPHIESQRDRILAYLEKGHSLTHLKAQNLFQCTRLAARLHELAHMGHVISKKWVSTSSKKKIKEYSLIQYQPEA